MALPQNPADLTHYIVKTYHDKHRLDLPILLENGRKLEGKEGFPKELMQQLDELYFIIESHLAKEENILFPMIQQGTRGDMLNNPISVMMSEHEMLDKILENIQISTNKFKSGDEKIQQFYQTSL